MAAPSNLILDTAQPGATALVLMGTVFVVTSLLFLLTPWPPTQGHAFLFVLGFAPGCYMLWFGGRRRRVWLSATRGLVIERRELLGARAERLIPLTEIEGVALETTQLPVRRKLWQQMLTPSRPGTSGPTTPGQQIVLKGPTPPLLIESWRDGARAASRAQEIAKVGGWEVM